MFLFLVFFLAIPTIPLNDSYAYEEYSGILLPSPSPDASYDDVADHLTVQQLAEHLLLKEPAFLRDQ